MYPISANLSICFTHASASLSCSSHDRTSGKTCSAERCAVGSTSPAISSPASAFSSYSEKSASSSKDDCGTLTAATTCWKSS